MHRFVSQDLEKLITDQAQAQGYSGPEEFLRAVLGAPGTERSLDASEFDQLLDELVDEDLASLPADFSRADIYIDHD